MQLTRISAKPRSVGGEHHDGAALRRQVGKAAGGDGARRRRRGRCPSLTAETFDRRPLVLQMGKLSPVCAMKRVPSGMQSLVGPSADEGRGRRRRLEAGSAAATSVAGSGAEDGDVGAGVECRAGGSELGWPARWRSAQAQRCGVRERPQVSAVVAVGCRDGSGCRLRRRGGAG